MSFLKLEGLHAFCTGAAGGIGCAIVEELLGMWRVDYNAQKIGYSAVFSTEH